MIIYYNIARISQQVDTENIGSERPHRHCELDGKYAVIMGQEIDRVQRICHVRAKVVGFRVVLHCGMIPVPLALC